QGHDLLPVDAGTAIILVAEGHAGLVEGDAAAVGDRHPMGIAREIGKHRLRPGEGWLGIDYTALLAGWREVTDEGMAVGEPRHLAEEGKFSGTMEVEQPAQEQPTLSQQRTSSRGAG